MWWRFLVFCVLVTLVLFIVLSCIYGRPVVHLFFHRCCGEDIENDQVIFENFGNNFLRERLVATEENVTILAPEDEDEDFMDSTTRKSFKNLPRAFKNKSMTDYRDVTKVNRSKIAVLSIKDLDRNKSTLTTDTLLDKDTAQMENLTLFFFEDREFKNELQTEGLISKDSMEIENKFSFDDVGKAIDDMKKLINNHNPSTRDIYDAIKKLSTRNGYDDFSKYNPSTNDGYDVVSNYNPSTKDGYDVVSNYNPSTKDGYDVISNQSPSTSDFYDEIESDLMTEDDVSEGTTVRLRKRN